MDVLSDVLKVVKLHGALYHNAEFSAPWSVLSPNACKLAPYLAPDSHVIIYHFLTDGRASVRTLDGERMDLVAGDIVVFPHGDPHLVGNGSMPAPINDPDDISQIFSHGLKLWKLGGGGEVSRFICGFMACDPQLCQMFLGGLPRFFKVNIREGGSGQWLEDSIRFSVDHADDGLPGGQALIAKLSEVLFVETLRAYLAQLPAEQTGWMAAAHDPEVSKVLTLMHNKPCRPWTIASLAKEAGLSRSVLAERFRHYLGEPPMSYLTKWRLRVGAQMLGSTNYSVAQVAAEVGYESEAAFNRAFKREFAEPPARYRNQSRAARSKPIKAEKALKRSGSTRVERFFSFDLQPARG